MHLLADEDTWSDADLIAGAQGGSRVAFGALYRRYSPDVFRFARRMGSTPSAADDVVQDVFVAMMDNLSRYDPDRSHLVHYLFGIARNIIRSRSHRFWRREVLVDQVPESVEEFDPLGGRVRAERCQSVRVALAVLPMKYREVLVLCDMQDLDYARAAAVLDVPIGTVRSRLHRGRRLLMERLERTGVSAGARGWSWRTIW